MGDEEHDAEEEDFHFLLFGNDDGDDGSGSNSSEEEEDNDGGDDFEFLLGVQDGRPPIHHQEGDTCVFHAITFAAEMEMRRRVPTTDITFNADAFAADYERDIGMNLAHQSAAPVGTFPSYHREATGLRLFRRDGVLARSAAWEGERRLRISSYRVHRNVNGVSFARVAGLISEGRPVMGVIRGNERFRRLPPGEIYDYYLPDEAGPPGGAEDEMYTHAVAFVGYGVRQGREYLILANSHGVGFGEDGLARVYFESVYDDRFYTLMVSPPADQDRPSSSATVSPRLLHIGSRSSGSGAAHDHGFFFGTVVSGSSSAAPSSSGSGAAHDHGFFFDTVVSGSSSSAAPSSSGSGSGSAHDLGFFINTAGSISSTAPSSSDGVAQRFFEVGSTSSAATPTPFLDDGSAFSPLFSSPSDIQSFFNDDSAFSSPTTAHSFFVGDTSSTAPVTFFDDGSTAVATTGPTSSSTAPNSPSAGPASSSTAPSSSSLHDE